MSTLTLRPNGAGFYTNITYQNPGSGAHWEKVDEAVADEYDTCVSSATDTTRYRDSYALEDTAQSGTVNSVTVHHRTIIGFDTGYILPFLRLSGTDQDGTEVVSGSGSWLNGSETIARPGGGGWSFTDINNLEVGAGLKGHAGSGCYLTQIYIVVDYTEAAGRTTKNTRQTANAHPGVMFQTITGGHGY